MNLLFPKNENENEKESESDPDVYAPLIMRASNERERGVETEQVADEEMALPISDDENNYLSLSESNEKKLQQKQAIYVNDSALVYNRWSTYRNTVGLRLVNRSMAVLLAFSWNMSFKYLMWTIYFKGKECDDISNPGNRIKAISPGICSPNEGITIFLMIYALFITTVVLKIGQQLNKEIEKMKISCFGAFDSSQQSDILSNNNAERAINVSDYKKPVPAFKIVTYELILIAIFIIPAWSWAEAILTLSHLSTGPYGTLIFALFFTLALVFAVYTLEYCIKREKILRSSFLTADIEAILVAFGIAISQVWAQSIDVLVLKIENSPTMIMLNFGISLLTTIVASYITSKIEFQGKNGSVMRRQFEFLYEEITGSMVGLMWVNSLNLVLVGSFGKDNPVPTWGYLINAVVISLITYGASYMFGGFDITAKHIESKANTKRQTVHFLAAGFGMMMGTSWGQVAKSLFLLWHSDYGGILSYFLYIGIVTLAFLVLIYFVTRAQLQNLVIVVGEQTKKVARKVASKVKSGAKKGMQKVKHVFLDDK